MRARVEAGPTRPDKKKLSAMNTADVERVMNVTGLSTPDGSAVSFDPGQQLTLVTKNWELKLYRSAGTANAEGIPLTINKTNRLFSVGLEDPSFEFLDEEVIVSESRMIDGLESVTRIYIRKERIDTNDNDLLEKSLKSVKKA